MKTAISFLVLSILVFAYSLLANTGESKWISPWETFEEGFPANLSLVRRLSVEESWNRGFEELENYSLLHKDWSFENDRNLFEKIQIILSKYNSEIAIEHIPQIKLYIQNRIKLYSATNPEDVIGSYYFYLDFFPEDKRIASLFRESFLKIKSDFNFNNDGEAHLFFYMVRDLINQNKPIPLSYFKLLFNYCETFINLEKKAPTKNLEEALNLLLNLFESKEEQLPLITLQEWDYLLAQRNVLFKKFRKNKSADLVNLAIFPKIEENLYMHSILMQNKLWNFQMLGANLKWETPEVQRFIEHSQNALRTQFANSRPKETYQILFSQIEILRTLLDLKTSLDAQVNILPKSKPVKKWYERLKDFHGQALGILQLTQYSTSLIFQCYQQNLATKTCDMFRDYIPFQQNSIAGSHSGEWNLQQQYIYFPPGRYEFDPNSHVVIKAEKIDFHPLAFIYAPSGEVTIDALDIDAPWVDVSGGEEIQIPHVLSPGKRPWVKDSRHCQNRQYIDGATLVSIAKKRCTTKSENSEVCASKPEWTLFTIKNPYPKTIACASNAIDPDKNLVGDIGKMLDLGQAPDDPSVKNWINRASGSNAGSIMINVQNQLLNPLLLAQGGNGTAGLNGQASPLCNSENEFNSYKIVVSLSEDEYNKWLAATQSNSFVKITPLESEIYHHVGLLEVFLPRTSGSDGGSGGLGGKIILNNTTKFSKGPWKMKSYFLSGGNEGLGGAAGICGPNPASNGKNGLKGANGQFAINKK